MVDSSPDTTPIEKYKQVIMALALLATLAAASCSLVRLAQLATDPKHAFLLGYSPARIGEMILIILGEGIILAGGLCLLAGTGRTRGVQEWLLASHARYQAAITIFLLIFTLASLPLLLTNFQPARWVASIARLEPVLSWIGISAACIFIAALIIYDQSRPCLFNRALIIFVLIPVSLLFINEIPRLVRYASIVDLQQNHAVTPGGDDPEYIIPAINLLHGFGYTNHQFLPTETYHVLPEYPKSDAISISYRPPGTSLVLALIYSIAGTETIYPRMSLVLLAWVSGVLCLVFGALMAGWVGMIAGGFAGIYFIRYSQIMDYALGAGVINSEIPAVFWLTLFGVLFTLYLRKRLFTWLLFSSLALSMFTLTRGNFLPAVLFLALWLYFCLFRKFHRHFWLFIALTLFPVIAWSSYIRIFQASTGYSYVSQGSIAFSLTNNPDVLYGIGPDHYRQGNWPPGPEAYAAYGLEKHSYWPKDGENGYLMGLRFWIENLDDLPRLFYVKLRTGTWYHSGALVYRGGRPVHGIFISGIGLLLLCLGLAIPTRKDQSRTRLRAGQVLGVQVFLVLALFFLANRLAFWPILMIWTAIALLPALRSTCQAYELPCPNPSWFLAFIAAYLVSTMVFAGDGFRYHAPLDPLLMTISLIGMGIVLSELVKFLLKQKFTKVSPFNGNE